MKKLGKKIGRLGFFFLFLGISGHWVLSQMNFQNPQNMVQMQNHKQANQDAVNNLNDILQNQGQMNSETPLLDAMEGMFQNMDFSSLFNTNGIDANQLNIDANQLNEDSLLNMNMNNMNSGSGF